MRLPCLGLLLSLFVLCACGGGGSSSGSAKVVADQRIGASGGVLEIADGELDGLRISIPTGAANEPVALQVATAFAFNQPGFGNLSRGILIGPNTKEFALPVEVTLPFDAGRQSRPAVVLARHTDGRVIEIAGVTEPETGRVRFQTLRFASVYWVAQRLLGWVSTNPQGIFGSVPGFLPLQDGNVWTFTNGLTIRMTASSNEPNLQGVPLYRFVVSTSEEDLGLWLRRIDAPPFAYGPTEVVGEFSTNGGTDYQEVHDLSLFLPAEVTLGQPMLAVIPSLLYEPYGALAPTSPATTVLRVAPTGSDPLQTAVGRFDDVFVLDWSMQSFAPNGGSHAEAAKFTFARGVGPVAVEAFGRRGVLQSATVNGQPVAGAR